MSVKLNAAIKSDTRFTTKKQILIDNSHRSIVQSHRSYPSPIPLKSRMWRPLMNHKSPLRVHLGPQLSRRQFLRKIYLLRTWLADTFTRVTSPSHWKARRKNKSRLDARWCRETKMLTFKVLACWPVNLWSSKIRVRKSMRPLWSPFTPKRRPEVKYAPLLQLIPSNLSSASNLGRLLLNDIDLFSFLMLKHFCISNGIKIDSTNAI